MKTRSHHVKLDHAPIAEQNGEAAHLPRRSGPGDLIKRNVAEAGSRTAGSVHVRLTGWTIRWTAALLALAACIWLGALLALLARPTVDLASASGLYQPEAGAHPYRWTGSRVEIPIAARSGPTMVTLQLGMQSWPGHEAAPTRVSAGGTAVADFTVTPQTRDYHLLLPSDVTQVQLDTTVSRPQGGEWRYLGFQIFDVTATPSGMPWRTTRAALALALAGVLLTLPASWLVRRGYGPIVVVTLVALALRLMLLTDAPPGLHRDEAVSLVDAWSVLQTGRDHLGHLLPLAAFEAYGDWISPLLTYLEIPFVALVGPMPLAARLVTALAGALVAPALYALARELELAVPTAAIAALVAALSPWQMFLSRVAIPPGLVPLSWALCLLAAVRLVKRGQRSDALWFALAAGLALYAYPTMKLAAPVLVALTGIIGLWRYGRGGLARWWPGALMLACIWLPFMISLLANPDVNARFDQIGLHANSFSQGLAALWSEYSVYLLPDFYYISGDARKVIRGVPGFGAELSAGAPLLLIGLVALLWRSLAPRQPIGTRRYVWLLILGALILSPLPASLTVRNPNGFRAAPLAPLYALIVGTGAGVLWDVSARWLRGRWQPLIRWTGVAVLVAALGWQCSQWYVALIDQYPRLVASTWFFAPGLREAMDRTVELAPKYDEIWIDSDSVGRPYIYLLAARPMPPSESQALIKVRRVPLEPNFVTSIGRYHFDDLSGWPTDLPAVAALPDRFGESGYVLQEWQHNGRSLLILRGMRAVPLQDTDN